MKPDCVIGVDIGTQGTRAALYAADGALLAEADEPSLLNRPGPGLVEEDAERQFGSVCRTIQACLEKAGAAPGRVAAVAIDGQMAGIIGVGADGRAVTAYDSWLDTRCAPYIDEMQRRAGRAVLARTGNVPSFNHGPKILWWKGERPEVYARVAAFVQPGGYAAMRLCGLSGAQAFIDDTYLHFSGFAQNAERRWDPELCAEFGVALEKLPRIAAPMERSEWWTVRRPAPRGCWPARRWPPAWATPPPPSSPAGRSIRAPAWTWPAPPRSGPPPSPASPPTWPPASWAAAARRCRASGTPTPTSTAAGSTSTGSWSSSPRPRPARRPAAWPRRWPGSAPASPSSSGRLDDPYFIPHMEGRVMPSTPHMRGAWFGITRAHGLASLYRSLLEAVALEYALYRDAVQALHPGLRLTELRATGGGARDATWNALKAEVLEMPLLAVQRGGGAPMGAALVAAASAGVIADLASAARAWVKLGPAVQPTGKQRELYRARTRRYAELLEALAGLSTEAGSDPNHS